MATNEIEKKSVTGLDQAENRREAEYDLLTSLLEAADYKTSDDSIVEVEMRRNGKFLFTVHLHPLSDLDAKQARKKAITMMPNPNGKKLPPIEKEFDVAKFNSWLIYLATTEEDQQKIWGNQAFMKAKGLLQPVESIDILLTIGEKAELVKQIERISDMDDDDDEETQDEETFRP